MNSRGESGGAIAVVGIACQFPGARDPAEFHDLTAAGRTMFRTVPGPPGRTLRAALLDDWTATPAQFGGSAAGQYDPGPIHKLTAETIALALADAGLQATDLRDSGLRDAGPRDAGPRDAGPREVDKGDVGARDAGRRDAGRHGTGQAGVRAGLIIASSVLGVCEAACEGFGVSMGRRFPTAAYLSSPHAIAAACDALSTRELDVAIAGGTELGLDQGWLARQAAAGNLGTDEMRVYDAEPAGMLPGDGCGVVVLVRAADARAAGLPAYGEIAGWARLPASPEGAATALLSTYAQARIDPGDIHLLEGHGAGISPGDEAELTALARLRKGGKSTAALGAVSASIGHTRAAAGVASLIKTVTAMVAGTIPAGTGCPRPHPLIESGGALLRLPAAAEVWPGRTQLAAVNSLGTADPATGGVHFVLRREADKPTGHGRRRRAEQPAAQGTAPGHSHQATQPHQPGPTAPGRHSAPTAHENLDERATSSETTADETDMADGIQAPDGQAATLEPAFAAEVTAIPEAIPAGEVAVLPEPAPPEAAAPETAAIPEAAPVPEAAPRPEAAIIPADPTAPEDAIVPGTAIVPGAATVPDVATVREAATVPDVAAPEVAAVPDPAPVVVKTALAAVPRQQIPLTEPARSAPPGRTQPRERGGQTAIFALCGTEPTAIAATLDIAARSAADLSDADLRDLARHLAAAAQRAAGSGAPLRVTVTAATPGQLAAHARRAAQLLRDGLHRDELQRDGLQRDGSPATMTIEPGISIAAGAAGRIVLVFPGLAESTAEHTALLAASLSGLRLLDRIGVRAGSALGYSLGEITGLVWAGCLPAAEAARLAALRGRVLRGCATPPAAMARVSADAALARQLCATGGLHIAAYETPTSHLLTGPASGIRDLARLGAETGVAVEILPATSAMHSPAMASCAAPLRSVLAATQFAPPRWRLISSITGEQVRPADDIVGLLAGQLGRPVLFAQAMALAAREADLLVIAGPDPGNSLAAMAMAASGVPAIRLPAVADEPDHAATIAALFAAGAIGDLMAARPDRADENTVPVTWVVPPARHGETACGQNGAGRGTTVRSGKMLLMG